jgi:hypothetical protein
MNTTAILTEYQNDGTANSIGEANDRINETLRAIPVDARDHFRTCIRYINGRYQWSVTAR